MKFTAPEIARLSRLLDQALDLPDGARPAWLRRLPTTDRPLEPALAEMLGAAPAGTAFLATLPRFEACGPPPRPAAAVHAGDCLGPYRLVREIGFGGMSTVWLADTLAPLAPRTVALKLPHAAGEPDLAPRVARERDIAARLAHPHIARMLDAGIAAGGRPFLAFEYLDGLPIDGHCDAHALPLGARVALVVQVARAVAHAHRCRVVHCDLKPSNVLVTADGIAHLLDFGVARLLDEPAVADPGRPGRDAMTPVYAAPEQLRGEAASPLADVYALGVLLYELATGRLPWDPDWRGRAAAEAARSGAEPPLASRRVRDAATARRLRGDVDAILARALRHDPADRYRGADALADDLERWLRGAPVHARRDPLPGDAATARAGRRPWSPVPETAASERASAWPRPCAQAPRSGVLRTPGTSARERPGPLLRRRAVAAIVSLLASAAAAGLAAGLAQHLFAVPAEPDAMPWVGTHPLAS